MAEEPLMADGSCLLGSINLSEFVVHPFSKNSYFDYEKFSEAVEIAVKGLNDVLDEGINLHPLEGQRNNARDWRQIGLGIMALADTFIKLGISYGSEESYEVSNKIGSVFADTAIKKSSLLARDFGCFPRYDKNTIFESNWLMSVCSNETIDLIKKYGLRNSQILTIAPTGSISTMWGISGGIEPIFAKSYKRKTESLHGKDVVYDVYTPIVLESMKSLKVAVPPSHINTSHDLDWKDRVKMQGIWQRYIDASISSTVNLPKSATIEDCENLFIESWKQKLKGVTIFRDGCKRAGILTIDEDDTESEKEEIKQEIVFNLPSYENDSKYQNCPECGEKIEVFQGACSLCMNCGYSPCS